MDKLIIASTQKRAGKTSITVGLTKAIEKRFGYLARFSHTVIASSGPPSGAIRARKYLPAMT